MAIFFFSGLLIFFPSKKLLIYHIEEYLVREIKTRTPAISLVSIFFYENVPRMQGFFFCFFDFFLWVGEIFYSFIFRSFSLLAVVLALLGLSIY